MRQKSRANESQKKPFETPASPVGEEFAVRFDPLAISPAQDVSIAAIGASAGGIEALTNLLQFLPANTGLAFVLVQHLDPKHHSMLTELLSRKTSMTVVEVSDGLFVQPNHIYVIPPNTAMSISQNTLQLIPREESRGPHMPVDYFMRALAQQKGNRAIGVILSGTGSDGTLGMSEIQAHGGVTFAQDEASAKYSGMPRSAIAAGYVDHVLSPNDIARELARLARHPYIARNLAPSDIDPPPATSPGLSTIFHILRDATGVDFTHYRRSTILRRIDRRMVVHKIDKIDDYVKYVQKTPAEVKALHRDMLINVTSFFRNPHVFETLKSAVFPVLFNKLSSETAIRIWTPGCASGEETYSLAIALLEFLGDRAANTPIQFFGTDASELSIARARNGFYPENIQNDVSLGRRQKFFTKTDGGYRISKYIRDLCIFAQHNLLSDPPFSQMDLICCRNVLIYLEPVLQSRVISLFHFALRPGGFLVLGSSEGVTSRANLFAIQDRTHKIFSKNAVALRQLAPFGLDSQIEPRSTHSSRSLPKSPDLPWNYSDAQKEFDRRLVAQFAPATVFVNSDLDILHTRGEVNRYLKLASGRASLNLLKMVREGLLIELRNAVAQAKKENAPVTRRNLHIKAAATSSRAGSSPPDAARTVNLDVVPLALGGEDEIFFMIVFQEAHTRPPGKLARGQARPAKEIASTRRATAKLEQELSATKEYLQSVIETQEATNEELQSANEEILSANEELQSTNEEMETAKEELQSTNEELSTVNDELRNRNQEMTQLNNDLVNLLSSIDIAVIMIGSDLTIRRFTPKAQKFLGLLPADIGRPLSNINPTIEIADLQAMILQVIADFRVIEKELTDRSGVHYQFKILPYRTLDNKIDGAVMTIVDIAPDDLGKPRPAAP